MPGRSSRGRTAFAVASVALLAAVAWFAAGEPTSAAGGGGLKLHRVGFFENPVYVAQPPGTRKLLFVVEQPGAVRVLRSGKAVKRPFLNIRNRVRPDGEQGLLSIAFHPRYAKNRRFYVYYVNNGGDIEVDSLRTKRGDPTRADPKSRRKLIGIAHPVNTQPQRRPAAVRARRPPLHRHRRRRRRRRPESERAEPRRAARQAAADRAERGRRLLVARVEPVRRPAPGSTRSSRSGCATRTASPSTARPTTSGSATSARTSGRRSTTSRSTEPAGPTSAGTCSRATTPSRATANPPADYRRPVFEYSSANANCSVTGGYVSRDPTTPALQGRYLYADFCGGSIRSFDPGSPDRAHRRADRARRPGALLVRRGATTARSTPSRSTGPCTASVAARQNGTGVQHACGER